MIDSQPNQKASLLSVNETQLRVVREVQIPVSQLHPLESSGLDFELTKLERLRHSIQKIGLQQPLTVAQKPGEEGYSLAGGGRARLLALKQLSEQGEDSTYTTVPCRVINWPGEARATLDHLITRTQFGARTFISRALQVVKAIEELRKHLGCEQRTHVSASLLLDEYGIKIPPSTIGFMEYAVKRLLPVFPNALNAGMGRPTISKIRTLERALGKEWQVSGKSQQSYDEIFNKIAKQSDGVPLDFVTFRARLLKQDTDPEISIEPVGKTRSEGEVTASVADGLIQHQPHPLAVHLEERRMTNKVTRETLQSKRRSIRKSIVSLANQFGIVHCFKATALGLGITGFSRPDPSAGETAVKVWEVLVNFLELSASSNRKATKSPSKDSSSSSPKGLSFSRDRETYTRSSLDISVFFELNRSQCEELCELWIRVFKLRRSLGSGHRSVLVPSPTPSHLT